MRTTRQKYMWSHWWKFTDWDFTFFIALIGISIGCFALLPLHGKHVKQAADSVAVEEIDTAAVC